MSTPIINYNDFNKTHFKKSKANRKGFAYKKQCEEFATLVLYKHYPGYPWAVEFNPNLHRLEILNMFICALDKGQGNGFIAAVADFRTLKTFDEREKTIMMKAGEMLERYNLPRTGNEEVIMGHIEELVESALGKQLVFNNRNELKVL